MAGILRLVAGVASIAFATHCAAAADPNKVLRIAFPTGETGFDPGKVFDLYSATVNEAIFDRLLTYEYLASPSKLAPMAAEAMPEVADEGRTYTFHIRKGVYFTPDPAFKGAKRELVAQDFVYSIMRFMDPVNRSQYAFLIEGKIKGLDDLAAAAKKSGKFDYDAKLPDMEAVDRYTLRFRLASRDYNFPYIVAHTAFGVVAREVIEAYANDTLAHPVGTGPYQLKEWKRGTKIVLEANPGFAGYVWDWKPTPGNAWDEQVVAEMKGKTMPQIGRVEISIMDEEQTRWLAFNQKEIDILQVPFSFIYKVINQDNQLLPEWVDQKARLYRAINASVNYTYFNFQDPVVGGFTKDRIALRRAIIMAFNVDELIRVVRKNQAVLAQMPIPPGVVGHDPKYRSLQSVRSGAREQAARPFRIQEGGGRLPQAPGRQAAPVEAGIGNLGPRARAERVVEEVHGRHRPAHRLPDLQVRRPPEGGTRLPADDVGRGLDGRLSRRRQFHAAPVRAQFAPEQQRLLPVARIRRVLRQVDADTRFAGAQPAVPRDVAADGSRRRVEPAGHAAAQCVAQALGARLQGAPDPPGAVAEHGPPAVTEASLVNPYF